MKRRLMPADWARSGHRRREAAQGLLEDGHLSDSLTRIYFAVFHAMKAVFHAADGRLASEMQMN